MKLGELLDLIDINRESGTEKIQLVYPNGDWDDYDEFKLCSPFLQLYEECEVKELEAMGRSVVRVSVDIGGMK